MDTLGPGSLSFIDRLSSLRRLKCTSIIEKGPQSLSLIEVFSIVSFSFTGGFTANSCSRKLFIDHMYGDGYIGESL